MIIVGRYIDGVYLNGIEWVLEGDEEEIKSMIFYDVEGWMSI